MEDKNVTKQHAQAVVEKAILIFYGPGRSHELYDMAEKMLCEIGEKYKYYLTNKLFRRGYLQRDYAGKKIKLSSKGEEALTMMDKVYAGE
ncbi:hypothetical protein EV210_101198 [Anaerospora hongkongensis]|uniref:Uncharacterized protein n=1 Tax=Anaerospora hongkongensis TaxID=244830 RepID=A0A4R1Q3D2_9FIRM|nr:hypothetical protein [Anaerospora hongkongensis]TCL39998.1 hypothetical protein EV210_101198 [Anaerospora hongkongensis]